MAETLGTNFPKGGLAQRLRKILYPGLTEHDVEAIVVCLMAHLLVEGSINGLLFRWLMHDAPALPEDERRSKAKDALWKNIVKIDFAKKYSIVEPFFAAHFPKEAKYAWQLNHIRNNIFHGHAIEDAKFEGQPISEEKTVERIFLAAQSVSMRLDKFEEMLDTPHALAERWSKRLSELGEPLV